MFNTQWQSPQSSFVLDLCAGSATGAQAAQEEGLHSVSIDSDSAQLEGVITRLWQGFNRINDVKDQAKKHPDQFAPGAIEATPLAELVGAGYVLLTSTCVLRKCVGTMMVRRAKKN